MSELLAPNGKPSNLIPEQYKLVRRPAFKEWFGDWENLALTKINDSGIDEVSLKRLEDGVSKIIDNNGEPLPVYHGTSAEPFVIFDGGSFFTDDYMNADGYASGEMVYEVFLNIKKPLIINAEGRKWDNLENEYGSSTKDIVGQLDMDKYDGVIFNNINDNWFDDEMGDTQNVYFSINPEQIKLADGTNTKFDGNNPDIRFDEGGCVPIDDKFKKGGRTIAQTPAPKKERIYGSEKNKPESSKDTKSAEKIEFNEKTLETIKNKVAEHNEKNPKKKVTLASAKAVVRRGMGAYSSSHRPTISGGKPNSRVAWGLARLNAFFYKIINGKSKSGKYNQDDDLINELGYKVKKYANGGDIQAYEEAMGISQFNEGGEAKPKKVYVSIKLPYDVKGKLSNYFNDYNEEPFKELKNGVLEGLIGVSTSANNIAEWFIARDCLIVMDYDEFVAINETETINYNDPYQLMKNNLFLFKRLYGNIGAKGSDEDNVSVFTQTLTKILGKVVPEINLEMNISQGQRYSELYRISKFLNPYETSAFSNWIVKNELKIDSPIDLTNAILDFNKLYDNWLGEGFENPVLTFEEMLPIVEKGITNASRVYESEQEIVLTNRKLNIPKNSQLFFVGKDEVGRERESNRDELIKKYNLKQLYKVYFVDRQQIQKYRDIWFKKQEEKFKGDIEKGRQDLELKKEQVLYELLNYFLEKSINYIKNELEKEILMYSETLDFYDETDDNYVEQNIYSIPLVESIMNTYRLIVENLWKSYIAKKQVGNLDLYAFNNFYFNVESELKRYFNNNKYELEKLNNYRSARGSGSLDPYTFERLLLKTINDYERLPELIDYKDLSKMYLDKMGREIYRYYDKNDLKLVSQYKLGGETELNNKKKMENEILVIDMDMYWGNTNVNFMNKEIPLKINAPINQLEFIEWAEENDIEFEQWGDAGEIDTSWGYTFEIPLFKYIEYLKTESYYTGGELKKGIKTEMEHKDTIKKIKTGDYSVKESAELIAKDHLEENDKYYTHLLKMEKQFAVGGQTDEQKNKISKVMREFYKGTLKTSYGETVTDRQQALAIALSEAGVEKKENGGRIETIHSQKGDIKISLDENWYSKDSDVELVPVSELIKFREFDRRKNPKYNIDNSRDNINHLKYMFQKEGIKSPLIIEYSPEDNAVLLIEGNHRLNSAIDLGMEYLPAHVVLRKYSGFPQSKIKSSMQVVGVKADESGYIPSNLKPSQVGITGSKPLIYEEGGIIEGQLHSECNEPHGCGEKFQVGEGGHIIEAERDEAVIVSEAFNDNSKYTIKGTPSEIASALNVLGDGKNFDKGATIEDANGNPIELPKMKQEATNKDVEPVIESGSIIINRRSMADDKEYSVTGTPKQIASAINSLDGNGVVIEKGAKIEKS